MAFFFQHTSADVLDEPFANFRQRDVTDETIADGSDHVHVAAENIAALDVTYKVKRKAASRRRAAS